MQVKDMEIKKEDLKILFTAEQIQHRIKEIALHLNSIYKDEEVYVVCVLKGAVMFAVDLVKYLKMPLKMEFIRLSSYGHSTTTSGKVNAVDISLPDLNGKNVLVVEDIVDTGLTAKFLLDFINNNFKTKTTKFCSLLDKKCFRKTQIEPDFVGFDVDDKFVIGYGLDFEGHFRNIPYIGHVENL
ncbi:MAG TPA: hypoxanthine phosphoribosyltransferase [Candidatus Gastranaerophilaceae bacterium]|nr:hypoxanthine phosphoribosyltransferase [Candidatus Gastranaerophilaceae bacterium]